MITVEMETILKERDGGTYQGHEKDLNERLFSL